ncbi:titin isoform X1 [Diorhabda carinulata]|uniref:titin isoform X1 n=1 Tax=Diorhabda carinulata TaxID=1163345 RepID=UPI0025A0E5F1|nr:titin isoform X1 [Diorhabda carinulata]
MTEMKNLLTMILFASLVFVAASSVLTTVATEYEVRAFIGDTVALPCRVDIQQCGQLHSVKWYKDANRVYVLSHHGSGRAEGGATERMTVEYTNETNGAVLKISPVEGEDEATYKCEITYLVVKENCDVIQIVKLKTLKIPDVIKIHRGGDHTPLPNATVIGPLEEEDEIDLICEATGGKPTPIVSWYNGTTYLKRAKYVVAKSKDDVEMGMSTLRLNLKRGDLLARFECRVESEALEQPIISWVQIDVNVRPLTINLTGVENHVVQGTNVKLDCKVSGARPPATIRWTNGSSSINEEDFDQTIMESPISMKQIEEKDGTFTTISSLSFKASHWENGKTIFCYAENEVMRKNSEPEYHSNLILDVRYPPVITVKPTYAETNESTDNNVTYAFFQCVYFANPQELKVASWLKDGKPLVLNDTKKYVGGTTLNPPLYIMNVTREDMGDYACSLGNEIGTEISPDVVTLNVIYTPDVEVVMDPSTPVKASDKKTVLITCNVTSGNPTNLTKVRWYLGGELMKEFPECNYTNIDEHGNGEGNGGPFCGLDPSILSLERVDESFAGNYTCKGMNAGGWGPESEPQELIVYYAPGPAKIRYSPSKVVKGGSVNLTCTVEFNGRPDNVSYVWHRGSHVLSNVTQSVYTIASAGLETRNNFSCAAENEGGRGAQASVFVNVYAAPAFTKKPPTYQGILYTSKNINLTCIVECYPQCSIVWYIDTVKLDTTNNHLYTIETHFLPSNLQKNDFESINSTLIWNMSAWPGKMLNKSAANTNYTCQATSNNIGAGVSSTAEIAVDYPPEDVDTSLKIVNVNEGEKPAVVKCFGKGRPTLSYQWRTNYTSEPISSNEVLDLQKITRSDSTAYICEASNKHGSNTSIVYFNIRYAPECSITRVEKDGQPALVCTALANPQDMTFLWRVKEGNKTSIETNNIIQEGVKSYLLLDSSVENDRNYYCIANNSIGFSDSCQAQVNGNLSWWNQDKMIIIIASVVAIIIFVIIICIIIIILCRRKRADTKYNSPLEMEERENPDGHSPDSSDQSRWPLQPGVLIHINKMNNISISQLSPRITPYKSTSVTTLRKFTKYSKYKRNKSKIYARLERIADFLGMSRGRERIPSGIKESASGVMTFRKVQPNPSVHNPRIRSRKRKKPGSTPNMSSTEDKPRLGGGLPHGGTPNPLNDPDKGFYENLPFHGMQNPTSKNAFYTLSTPNFKQLNITAPPQYSATIPHQKHTKLIPKALFQEQTQKSKSFSSKSKQKKNHFQIPLQKCNSFKFQTAESYFQPIKNIHEENLMRNGYVSDYPESTNHRSRHHKREKHKQKSKGPLVLRRASDYQENVQFQESINNSVQLQYPQPLLGRQIHAIGTNKPNGVVYADLDMPPNKRTAHDSSNSSKTKSQSSKQKTEYATLKFNDIGQEIDV